jgi:hypothetical protein
MSLKFSHFTEEKLEKQEFPNNAGAHLTIQAMMGKYESMYLSSYILDKRNA